MKFENVLFRNSQQQKGSILRCKECQAKIKCDVPACKTPYPKTYWSANERKHKQQRGTLLVCKSCRARGCTADDLEMYPCQTCKEMLGTKRFGKDLLKDHKYHGKQKLQCSACMAVETARVKELQVQFRKSKVFCKCFRPLHAERCPLSPSYYGQSKWPGSDGHV